MKPQTWIPTHEITIRYRDRISRIRAMEVDRVLYTRQEWEHDASADWSIADDGTVVFQGQIPPCVSYSFRRLGRMLP